jgi:hypothetical protein
MMPNQLFSSWDIHAPGPVHWRGTVPLGAGLSETRCVVGRAEQPFGVRGPCPGAMHTYKGDPENLSWKLATGCFLALVDWCR